MKYLSGLLILIILTGCATIMRGTKEEPEFTSNTDSANVYVDGKDIRAKKHAPEIYDLLFLGAGWLPPSNDEDNEYREKRIFFPEFNFQTMRSYKDKYHFGVGLMLHYIDRYWTKENTMNNVYQIGMYAVCKYSPVTIFDDFRSYLFGEIGSGVSLGKRNGRFTGTAALMYTGWGLGIEYKEKLYFEMSPQVQFLDLVWGEGLGLGNEQFMLRAGYRFSLSEEIRRDLRILIFAMSLVTVTSFAMN